MKRDSVSAYVHIRRDTPSPCTQLYALWINGHFLNQKKKRIQTFEYRIYWNINIQKNKFLYEKINGCVGWNKNSGEQH